MTPAPPNLARSMAEEIRRDLQTQLSGVENEPFSERVKIWKEAQEIIQRRIEPITQVIEAAEAMFASKPKSLDRVCKMEVLRQALSKL